MSRSSDSFISGNVVQMISRINSKGSRCLSGTRSKYSWGERAGMYTWWGRVKALRWEEPTKQDVTRCGLNDSVQPDARSIAQRQPFAAIGTGGHIGDRAFRMDRYTVLIAVFDG